MNISIEYRPSYGLAICQLQPGESVRAESGAMVSMNTHVRMETSATHGKGVKGLLKGLARKVFMGESFFMNTFHADQAQGEVTFAPRLPGDVEQTALNNESLVIQGTSYMCSSPDIEINTKWGGFKTLFGGEGLFMIEAKGTGPVVFNAFGAIHALDLNGPFVVDTGHIVAFQPSLNFKIKRVGGWYSTFFSGEGLVCEFNGQGRLWIQSRNPKEFGTSVGRMLPPRRN